MGTIVLVLSQNTIHLGRIGIGCDDSDGLIVLPQGDSQVLRLVRPTVTSLLETVLHKWFQLRRETFAVGSQHSTAIQPISARRSPL